MCLISNGVGRDNISDFTVNLVLDFLCQYTQEFAQTHIDRSLRRQVWIERAKFNYETESWARAKYELPWINGDFVLLTPKDILTRDDTWINRTDMIRDFEEIPPAIPDRALRGQVSNYFQRVLAKPRNRYPNQQERADAAARTLIEFPQLIDYYIKMKEDTGDEAVDASADKIRETQIVFGVQVRQLQYLLSTFSLYYKTGKNTYSEAHKRLAYLKDVIENKGGHKIFYHNGKAIKKESDLHILFRFVWIGSPSDVGAEANDGRGPVDYKISRRAKDKTLVEMKLTSNTSLERNLEKQLPVYQAASDAKHGIKAIIYFSAPEKRRVDTILKRLKLTGHKDVVLIDARNDNKPSGSKA